MKKKEYEKPSMKVYELKQQPQLLAGSNGGGTDDYTPDNNDYNW
jgi:hypothetical protein